MDLKEAFGKIFTRARKAAKLTQEDFEPISPRTYISHLERGKSAPSIVKINDLSEVIGVHPASLIFQTYLLYDQEKTALDLMATIMDDLKKMDRMNDQYE
jgi:transcriptional regulator with XRE-family HTH domain